MKKHWKLILFISVEFAIVIFVILLTMFAGRKSYTVTFDLNGGTHLDGSLVQTVRRGHSATPPVAIKEGSYLLGWTEAYSQVTKDIVTYAIWNMKHLMVLSLNLLVIVITV